MQGRLTGKLRYKEYHSHDNTQAFTKRKGGVFVKKDTRKLLLRKRITLEELRDLNKVLSAEKRKIAEKKISKKSLLSEYDVEENI